MNEIVRNRDVPAETARRFWRRYRLGWWLAYYFGALGLFSPLFVFAVTINDARHSDETNALLASLSSGLFLFAVAWWCQRWGSSCPVCTQSNGRMDSTRCHFCDVNLQEHLSSRVTGDASSAGRLRSIIRSNRFRSLFRILSGVPVFLVGPALIVLEIHWIAEGAPLRLGHFFLAITLSFFGLYMMATGGTRCVVCGQLGYFKPGDYIRSDWVCADCLHPYSAPEVAACAYCGGHWKFANRYEKLRHQCGLVKIRCNQCGAPASPVFTPLNN
jgi:hypothetical protein